MEQCLMYTLAFLAGGTTLLGGAVAVQELRRRVKLRRFPSRVPWAEPPTSPDRACA